MVNRKKKPKRIFYFSFQNDADIAKWFDDEIIVRKKKIKGKIIQFKAYGISFEYHELKLQLSMDYKIKRKINDGRWNKVSV